MISKIQKRKIYFKNAVLGLVILLCVFTGWMFIKSGIPMSLEASFPSSTISPEKTGKIRVRIDGQVVREGIYYVPANTTVREMIEGYAQGVTPQAMPLTMDLDQLVWDGMSIFVE